MPQTHTAPTTAPTPVSFTRSQHQGGGGYTFTTYRAQRGSTLLATIQRHSGFRFWLVYKPSQGERITHPDLPPCPTLKQAQDWVRTHL